MKEKIQKVLIANRGTPAVRIIHTCRARKIKTTAVYSTPDRLGLHVFMADSAIHTGEAPPIESYLNKYKIIHAALQSKSDAIHPGWGVLAENQIFAQKVIDAELAWSCPSPEIIRLMGNKINAKEIAQKANIPTNPGIRDIRDIQQIQKRMK